MAQGSQPDTTKNSLYLSPKLPVQFLLLLDDQYLINNLLFMMKPMSGGLMEITLWQLKANSTQHIILFSKILYRNEIVFGIAWTH